MRRMLSAFASLGIIGIAAGMVGTACIDPATV